jgi:hypothetical protein
MENTIAREEYKAGVRDLARAARDLYPGRVHGWAWEDNDIAVLVRVNDWPWTTWEDMLGLVAKAVRYG